MVSGHKPRLAFLYGPGGPDPDWWLPRLSDKYQLSVLWTPSGDPRQDAMRSSLFDRYADVISLTARRPIQPQLESAVQSVRPDGLLAFSELVSDITHATAAAAGLPSTGPVAVQAMRNKVEQRRRLRAGGVPTPEFAAVRSLDDLLAAVPAVGLPAVLKPAVGVGSMATFSVTQDTDLTRLWAEADAAHRCDSRAVGSPFFILEEYLRGVDDEPTRLMGDQVSVESIVQGCEVTHMAVSDKFKMVPPFRETGDLMASTLPSTTLHSLTEAATRAIQALELDHCAVHTEFKLTARGPRIIEVNGRIGGGVTQLLHYAAGYDVIDAGSAARTGDSFG